MTKVHARTLEDLVRRLEVVDPEAALAAIRAFNRAVRPFDPDVRDGRGTRGLPIPKSHRANPLDSPPFEACAATCGVTFPFGGLRIDTTGRVLDGEPAPIPGLCAARGEGELRDPDRRPGCSALRGSAVTTIRRSGRPAAHRPGTSPWTAGGTYDRSPADDREGRA